MFFFFQVGNILNDADHKNRQRGSLELLYGLRREWIDRGRFPRNYVNEHDAEYKRLRNACYTVMNLRDVNPNQDREMWLAATIVDDDLFEVLCQVSQNYICIINAAAPSN